jgi:hypothetical protein
MFAEINNKTRDQKMEQPQKCKADLQGAKTVKHDESILSHTLLPSHFDLVVTHTKENNMSESNLKIHQHPEAILAMSAEELIEYARGEQMNYIMRFIDGCSVTEAAKIIKEIICVHDNVYTWKASENRLHKLISVTCDEGFDSITIQIKEDNY